MCIILIIFVNLSACIYSIWDCSDPTQFPLILTEGILKYWLCYWQILALLFFGRLANINRLLKNKKIKITRHTQKKPKTDKDTIPSFRQTCVKWARSRISRGEKSCPWYTNNKRVRDSLSTNSPSPLAWSKKTKQKQQRKKQKKPKRKGHGLGDSGLVVEHFPLKAAIYTGHSPSRPSQPASQREGVTTTHF